MQDIQELFSTACSSSGIAPKDDSISLVWPRRHANKPQRRLFHFLSFSAVTTVAIFLPNADVPCGRNLVWWPKPRLLNRGSRGRCAVGRGRSTPDHRRALCERLWVRCLAQGYLCRLPPSPFTFCLPWGLEPRTLRFSARFPTDGAPTARGCFPRWP